MSGILALVGFVGWELRQAGQLLELRLFRELGLAGGSVTLLAVFGAQAGIFVVLFPFLQAVLGWSALRTTLALLPMALLMMLSAVIAARLVARIGIRATIATGIFLGGTGLALMASLVSVDGGYLSVLPGMLAMGLGIGLAMTPATEAITSSLPRERQGVASALNDVTREFGTALGRSAGRPGQRAAAAADSSVARHGPRCRAGRGRHDVRGRDRYRAGRPHS